MSGQNIKPTRISFFSPVVGVLTVPQTDMPKKDKNQSKTNVMPKPALQQVRYLRETCRLISVLDNYRGW